MADERHILCGEESAPVDIPAPDLRLSLFEQGGLIRLNSEDIRRGMLRNLPDRFIDLIEIATFVYCADQAFVRGGNPVESFGHGWRRNLVYHIPVRDLSFWQNHEVQDILSATLGFLSEDDHQFRFRKILTPPPAQQYLEFPDGTVTGRPPNEVVLFSGGLDSLGGAIEEIVFKGSRPVLVTHRSHHKFAKVDAKVRSDLASLAGQEAPFHLTVRINKADAIGKEYTQRARSFLYVAIGATVARMLGLSRVRFYENGVISLNLPIAEQVVGARATRTTHPRVLAGFAQLISHAAETTFAVENPFQLFTRADVVRRVLEANCGQMIRHSRSCTHTKEITTQHSHCGACSQCIDRRFGILAAGGASYDPAEAYKHDLFLAERPSTEDRTMLISYVQTALDFSRMTEAELASRYGEIFRVLGYMEGEPVRNASRVLEMLNRHGNGVLSVVERAVSDHAGTVLWSPSLPPACLLRLLLNRSAQGAAGAGGSQSNGHTDHRSPQHSLPEPDNQFLRLAQDAWEYRFQGGKKRVLVKQVGAAQIEYLLASPNVDHDVEDLHESTTRSNPQQFDLQLTDEETDSSLSRVNTPNGPIEVADHEYLRSLHRRWRESRSRSVMPRGGTTPVPLKIFFSIRRNFLLRSIGS
jgi:hypothetical protein